MKPRPLLLLQLLGLAAGGLAGQAPPAPTVLHPGDALRVEIWREEDLSGEFRVDESGRLTLPLLGERAVAGTPWPELRDALLEDYRQQLRNPSISLTPLRRIFVLGEVNQPGLLAVDPTVSLAGAVAMAGGASPQGELRNLRVVRDGEVILQGVPMEAALASVDVRSGDQIFVGRRSWLDRNSTFVVSALLSLTSLIVALAR